MNTPQPIDWATLLEVNPEIGFQVDLLTADPADDTFQIFGNLSPVVDPGYSGQIVYRDSVSDDGQGNVVVNLQPAEFATSGLAGSFTIEAYSVSAVFDDGLALVGVYSLPSNMPFNSNVNPIVIPASLFVTDYSNMPVNWS